MLLGEGRGPITFKTINSGRASHGLPSPEKPPEAAGAARSKSPFCSLDAPECCAAAGRGHAGSLQALDRKFSRIKAKGEPVGKCYYGHLTGKETEAQHGCYPKQGFMVVTLELGAGGQESGTVVPEPMTSNLFSAASQLLDDESLCRFLILMELCGRFDLLCELLR
ncbi:unnamed protein product [Rangifer tarandus platyrhynchus]|uniref:Uncharacterized protein n=1 Tax=Rangifer tarandus platyrhynchus TaxID=3082113 RepID=A0AC59YLV7_RANTA